MSDHPLLRLWDLTAIGEDVWCAPTPAEGPSRLFGGQVASQALRAAVFTVPADRPPHSLHGYFIRPGQPDTDLELVVERTRDGRSFTTRHVTANQNGKAIFELTASFAADEEGTDWSVPATEAVDGPDDISRLQTDGLGGLFSQFPFEIRPTGRRSGVFSLHPCWVRLRAPIGDDLSLHCCALTFVSDLAMVPSARAPQARDTFPDGASLDHAIWFHRRVPVDQWLLFSGEPLNNYGARGLALGSLRLPNGDLVATVAQEALLRSISRDPVVG